MRMEARRIEGSEEQSLQIFRRGWCLGSPEFKPRLLERMEGKLGEHHSGGMRLETAQAKAQRIIQEELVRLGWDAGQLGMRRKNNPQKLAIAARLRRETTLPLKAIAAPSTVGQFQECECDVTSVDGRRSEAAPVDLPNLGI